MSFGGNLTLSGRCKDESTFLNFYPPIHPEFCLSFKSSAYAPTVSVLRRYMT